MNTDNIIIEISNLTKKFGNLTAVNSLSFNIYRNEVFGFLGPNGAGKTTTINMICGLSPATAGEIVILGNRIKNKNQIKSHIGICPQENIFWQKLTCLEQLIFMGEMYDLPKKKARTRSIELLEMMGLTEKSNVLSEKLSGGMKRRLNICLALIHDPEILILDEPEVGLDPQSRILVRNFIKTLAQEKTIILTTHNMDEADRLADRVAIIDHGKLLLLNTPANLKKTIGEGDILEIQLDAVETEQVDQVVGSLSKLCDQVNVTGNVIIIKAKNLIELVSEITRNIQAKGLKIKEMKMRENTLEDVFIHLTGRKLRE